MTRDSKGSQSRILRASCSDSQAAATMPGRGAELLNCSRIASIFLMRASLEAGWACDFTMAMCSSDSALFSSRDPWFS